MTSLLFLVSTAFAIICYRFDPKNVPIRWGVLLLSCAALAGLSRSIVDSIIPSIQQHNMELPWLNSLLFYLRAFSGFVSVYFFPWGVIMHAITYSGRFGNTAEKILTLILFLPIPVMLKTTVFVPDIIPDFKSMLYWAVPYITIACIIHIYALLTEKDKELKRHRFVTLSIILPVILSALILNYIMRAFDSTHHLWRYMIVFLLLAFFIFLWNALKEGTGSLNGIKLRYEREAKENAMKAITSGTALLNHTIKNQIYKINSSLHIIKPYSINLDPKCSEAIEIINRSSDHLMEMVDRIQSQTEEIKVQPVLHKVEELLNTCLELVTDDLQKKHIVVRKELRVPDMMIYCDWPHTKEVFLNILTNAIDALEDGGEICITTKYRPISREACILFADNGSGISQENLKHVTDPFFTTKKNRGTNFGLGLSYCSNVMTQTGGRLEIESELNKGTTVMLTFSTKGGSD